MHTSISGVCGEGNSLLPSDCEATAAAICTPVENNNYIIGKFLEGELSTLIQSCDISPDQLASHVLEACSPVMGS